MRRFHGVVVSVACLGAAVACGTSGLTSGENPSGASSTSSSGSGSSSSSSSSSGSSSSSSSGGEVDAGPDPCIGDSNAARCALPECNKLCIAPTHVPTGFGARTRDAALTEQSLATSVTLDTSTGAAGAWRSANADPAVYEVKSGIGFVRLDQGANQPSLAVWIFKSLAITGGTITATGSAAVVLASAGSLTLGPAATIDLSAKGTTPGAGGFTGGKYGANGAGCAFGQGSTVGGAGGGGFGLAGGGAAGAGGSASGCALAVDLTTLRGGSGGGGGDDSDSALTIPFGGAGGGAIQLTALGPLGVDGTIHVGGGGARTPQGNSRNGAGGGAGGMVFLESPKITVSASAGVYANGGGGGSNSAGTGNPCGGAPTVAENGKAALSAASGGHCGSAFGGNGGVGTTAAQSVTVASSEGQGGAGGGIGRVVLRTLPAATPSVSSTKMSPASGSAAYRVLQTLGP